MGESLNQVNIIILACGGALLTSSDIALKKWALTHEAVWGLTGLFAWFLGLLCLAATMKQTNIAMASVMLVYFNITSLALAEHWLFHTPMTKNQILGGVISLIGLLVMEI